MQQILPTKNRPLVGDILVRLRESITATREAQAAHLAEQELQRHQREAARRAEQEVQARIREERIAPAQRGLEAILGLGVSEEIQSILRLQAEADPGPIPEDYPGAPKIALYVAQRASGDAWDTRGKRGTGSREVFLSFRTANFYVEHGCFEIDPQVLIIPYTANKNVIAEAVGELYSPYKQSPGRARRRQWSYEWDPRSVAFQVLVDCASPYKFARYLNRGLQEIAEGYRRI